MKTTRKNKGFASSGQSLYDKNDFLWYFEQRVNDLIRLELNSFFAKMMYQY